KGVGLLFSDLLFVNKIDLALYVDIVLVDMQIDVKENRKNKPYVFISKKESQTLNQVVSWIEALM
ncbi:urease accessory protein UreG, partial [Aliarcobacter butzleri]